MNSRTILTPRQVKIFDNYSISMGRIYCTDKDHLDLQLENIKSSNDRASNKYETFLA